MSAGLKLDALGQLVPGLFAVGGHLAARCVGFAHGDFGQPGELTFLSPDTLSESLHERRTVRRVKPVGGRKVGPPLLRAN